MGTSKNQEAASGATVKKRGQFKEIWRRLKKNKMAMIGLGIVVFLVLISILRISCSITIPLLSNRTQLSVSRLRAQLTGSEQMSSDAIFWHVLFTDQEYP